MNDRKQHVIKMSHQLFIDKGFQATSIQDILDYSGISKGTFYNYFSSKNELFIDLFKTIYRQMEKQRNELLIGQQPSDINIFVKQIELQLQSNRRNKLVTLFEEVLVSNDEDLKQFIKNGQLRMIRWLYSRFIDIFGEDKKPYLLDCAVMFMGILHHNIKYYSMAYDSKVDIYQVVQYSVNRVVTIVSDVSASREQLLQPDALYNWLSDCIKADQHFHQKMNDTIITLKKSFMQNEEQDRFIELLDFINDEVFHAKKPRKFLIESAISSLKKEQSLNQNEVSNLEQLITEYFGQLEKSVEA
ncbi:TetR/AcrR family transcriptional regulator [Cytobacillus sp. FJAT-54145]|uniref:TetR/AcrR family transcriptional regulator n=1 Tax=Cytobacillus spartinae TaxID=3299023 RepID=A0ABW6KCX1_9BACI